MGRFANFRIGRTSPLPVVVKRLKPLTALSGTVYKLASSMSDHTPVLFNAFEDWNEESVVPRISFDSIRPRFERKRPIRGSLFANEEDKLTRPAERYRMRCDEQTLECQETSDTRHSTSTAQHRAGAGTTQSSLM